MARTEKVSITLDETALALAKKSAKTGGLSLSGLLMKLLRAHLDQEARFDHMARLIDEYAPKARVTEADMQAIRDEMTAPLKPVRRGKRRRAA